MFPALSNIQRLSIVATLALLVSMPSVQAQSQQARLPRLEPSTCAFNRGPALVSAKIECSWLIVQESRERAKSREIRLAVAVIRATKPTGAMPLVMLHGGPGQSGLSNFPARAFASAWGSSGSDVLILTVQKLSACRPNRIERCRRPSVDALITRFYESPLAMPDASCVGQIPRLQFATGW
jgi:hypothetical protein